MPKFLRTFIVFAFLLLLVLTPSFLLAQNSLTVTIRVGLVNLTLSGQTIPQAQVTIMEHGSVVGTTTADNGGNFSKTLTGLEEGIYQISLYATDFEGETTSTVVYSIALTAGTDTALENIILPSTVFLSETSLAIGDNLRIYGQGVISSTITLLFNGISHSYFSSKTTTADNNGDWEYNFSTDDLNADEYSVFVKISTADGYQSESSKVLSFLLQSRPAITPGASSTTTETTTTTVTVTATPTPGQIFLARIPDFLKFFDIDGSGRIELREIFDSVKLWVDSWHNQQDYNCDLNNDNICNIIDFSILMSYIGR